MSTAKRRAPRSVLSAAKRSQRTLLEALRNKIAKEIDEGVPARDLASLSKRLLEINQELDALEKVEDGDDVTVAAEMPDEAWGG